MGLTKYADLEIRILKLDGELGYPVEITFNGDREFPRGHLSRKVPEPDELNAQATGESLFAWLFGEITLAKAWAEARGLHSQRRIRLRIDEGAPELHALPWETLRDPESGDLAAMKSTPFSRYLAGPWMPGNPILKRPIRVLVAIANPVNLADSGLQAIDGDREWELIQLAVAGVSGIELTRLPDPCSLTALEEAVRKGIHILHFVGHGSYDEKKRTGSLLLADDKDNRIKLAEDHEIAEMLRRQLANTESSLDDKLRLVYLSSCQTATRDSFDAFRGLAPRVVDAGVPAVVAMQDFVPVTTAEAFEKVFYRELMVHGEVDRAANAARASLLTAKIRGAAIPVLFLRLRSGQLLGKRGVIVGDVSDAYWRTLVNKIRRGQCTPILGPGVASALLPSPEDLAQAISASHYPFADSSDLRRVSQFLGTMDNADMRQRVLDQLTASLRRNLGSSNSAADIKTLSDLELEQWKGLSQRFETEIHEQLAALGLPLYVTTNFDNFMTRALQSKLSEGDVRREAVIWREAREERPALDPPSAGKPVVLHLFGDDREPESMVLTEDDHLDYLARISHDQEIFLPASVNALLAKNTLLFLGYRLQDLDLKVILRGLLTYLALTKYDRMQLAVQIETEQHDASTQKEVTDYLQQSFRQYFSSKSDVKVYWGSAQQFMADLTARMRELPNG